MGMAIATESIRMGPLTAALQDAEPDTDREGVTDAKDNYTAVFNSDRRV